MRPFRWILTVALSGGFLFFGGWKAHKGVMHAAAVSKSFADYDPEVDKLMSKMTLDDKIGQMTQGFLAAGRFAGKGWQDHFNLATALDRLHDLGQMGFQHLRRQFVILPRGEATTAKQAFEDLLGNVHVWGVLMLVHQLTAHLLSNGV